MKRVLVIFGTRPEAIKLAMVIRALRECSGLETGVVVTAQHRQMLDQVLTVFDITPDYDLNIMSPGQDLFDITSRSLDGLKPVLQAFRPDMVLVQGDTTTTCVGSLAAYYLRIPVGHVEAGLRTGNPYSPFPEEINRRVTGVIAALHFAPTVRARDNLQRENVPASAIHVTGNTAIDALLWTLDNTRDDFARILGGEALDRVKERFLLVTTHRRESFGEPMRNTMLALARIARRHPEVSVVFPVHLNPHVREQADQVLRGIPNVVLTEPLDYKNFAHLMGRSFAILTDSGGIQEEAPSLGKPVLVLRDNTERPEGVEAGTARLVGTDPEAIVAEAERLLVEPDHYRAMVGVKNPYGDGLAARRISAIVRQELL